MLGNELMNTLEVTQGSRFFTSDYKWQLFNRCSTVLCCYKGIPATLR